jgi:hypothetical protein
MLQGLALGIELDVTACLALERAPRRAQFSASTTRACWCQFLAAQNAGRFPTNLSSLHAESVSRWR